MRLRSIFENLNRTGQGKAAVVGWGRGMGHKGHMYLADAVITQAEENNADPYFVVSRTVGKDDPITPEEKLHIYKKVFPKHGHIFHTATDEMPDLNRVLTQLGQHGYTDATVIVGADQKAAFQYLVRPDKSGVEPYKQFGLKSLHVISRQETNSKYSQEEGPRATPMRHDLMDPKKSEEEKFQTWRDSMSPEVSDDEVRDLMHKAHTRMSDPAFGKAAKKPKKEKAVAEIAGAFPSPNTIQEMDGDGAGRDGSNRKSHSTYGSRDKHTDSKGPDIHLGPKNMLPSKDMQDRALDALKKTLSKPENMAVLKRLKTKESKSDTMANTAKRLTDPNDGKTAKLRAAGDKRREEHLKSRDIAKKNEGVNLIKYANKLLREMKAQEFIREGKTSELHPDHEAVMKGVSRSRDVGGYDRVYHMNRLMMAMAMANGHDTKKVDGAAIDTWAEKFNTMHPMTQEEDNKIRAAMKTIPTDGQHISTFGKSREADGANTKSIVAKPKRNKYGV